MPPSNTQSSLNYPEALNKVKPNLAFVVIILGALIAFEIFNYSTTDHALRDLLGNLTFAGLRWSTILAIAFCGIDFAGIARLFTPEQGSDEPKEVWYLFGAWLLAATMNAVLTWWGVSMAIANHSLQSSTVIDPQMITTVVPLFVAIMVWVIRILIIGSLSLAMDRLLHPGASQVRTAFENALDTSVSRARTPVQPTQPMNIPATLQSAGMSSRPVVSRAVSAAPAGSNTSRFSRGGSSTPPPVDEVDYSQEGFSRIRPEPTYHSLSMSARPPVNGSSNNNGGASNNGGSSNNGGTNNSGGRQRRL
jgi:uncharacterized membrane protein YgcG